VKKIAFLAPSEDKLDRIRELLKDYEDEVVFAVGSLRDGLAKAEKLIKQGIEIIIARGETAFNIRDSYPEIVVLDVPISGFDLALALEGARKIGDNVAVVCFASMIKQIECLESALGVHIKKYHLHSREHVDRTIDKALKDGADVILGGYTTNMAARKRGLPHVEIITGDQAYVETFYNSRSILKSIEVEKRRSGFIKTVLNHAYEGILSIDEKGTIYSMNPIAQKILKVSVNDNEKVNIADVWPELKLEEVLRSGKNELNQFYKIHDTQILCNKVPITDQTGAIGAVATFQDITKIQMMESKIRKEIYSKGHVTAYTFENVYAFDQATKTVIEGAKSFAATEANILITGETGTGKEVFAQSIHAAGKRCKGPFVAVNCAALPAQLLESELFGYVSGAFTGASREGKPGLFEIAHNGTIFLDEIGEMDYTNQGRLLRVLQERSIMRLGSDRVIPVSVRIIAATNKNLRELVAQGKFREDLYYRLNVLNLWIPPLRSRQRDIAHYARMFLEEIVFESGKNIRLSTGALRVLENYSWPGNIRELRNIMERVAAIAQREVVSTSFISQMLAVEQGAITESTDENEEAARINKALGDCDGKIAEAAKFLKMSRTTLWRKMNQLSIKKS